MTHQSIRQFRGHRQRGQAMVEYAIICAVLAVCLFGTPVGKLLTDALRNFYGSLIFFLSLP
jgi:Flp pilus assembly pilin Flp